MTENASPLSRQVWFASPDSSYTRRVSGESNVLNSQVTLIIMASEAPLSSDRSKPGRNLAAQPTRELYAHLIRHRLKRSKQRDLILTAFGTHRSVTAQNLYMQLARKGHRISLGTVYRTMNLFCRMGIAKPQHFGARTQYDGALVDARYDNLICTQCGRIVEFNHPDIERLRQEVATANGFSLMTQKLELYGHCATCRD